MCIVCFNVSVWTGVICLCNPSWMYTTMTDQSSTGNHAEVLSLTTRQLRAPLCGQQLGQMRQDTEQQPYPPDVRPFYHRSSQTSPGRGPTVLSTWTWTLWAIFSFLLLSITLDVCQFNFFKTKFFPKCVWLLYLPWSTAASRAGQVTDLFKDMTKNCWRKMSSCHTGSETTRISADYLGFHHGTLTAFWAIQMLNSMKIQAKHMEGRAGIQVWHGKHNSQALILGCMGCHGRGGTSSGMACQALSRAAHLPLNPTRHPTLTRGFK